MLGNVLEVYTYGGIREVDGAEGGAEPSLVGCDRDLVLSQCHQLLGAGMFCGVVPLGGRRVGSGTGFRCPPPREEMCDLGEPGPFHEGGGSVIPGEDFGRELSAGNTSGRRSNEGPGPRRRDVGTQHSIPYKYQPQGLSGRVTCSEDLHMIVREHAHTSGSINGG